MPNYLGGADSSSSGNNNGGYQPEAGGDTINPLTKDIVPDFDDLHNIGQSSKRLKTGYFTRLDVVNPAPPILVVAIQSALSVGGSYLQDFSAGFGFTSLKELTVTRIYIQKSVLPSLPSPRTVKIWQESDILLHTGSISNANDDGLNWYTDVNWIIPANVAIRYATDVPNGTNIHTSPAANFTPIFVDFIQSVRGSGFGVYPDVVGGFPAVPLGNFRFTIEPDTSITYNGTPVALLTDLTDGNVSLTNLQQKTQHQSATSDTTTFNFDVITNRDLYVVRDSVLGNTLVSGELHCDQKEALFDAGIAVTGNIDADNLSLPGFADVDATLTSHAGNLTTLNSKCVNLQGFTSPQPYNELQGGLKMFGITGVLEHSNLNAIDMTVIDNIFFGRIFGNDWANLQRSGTQMTFRLGQPTATSSLLQLNGSGGSSHQIKNDAGNVQFQRNSVSWLTLNTATNNVLTPSIRALYLGAGTRPVVSGGFVQTADSVTVVSSTTETVINGTGVGTLTMSANSSVAGSCSLFRIRGSYGTNVNNTVLELRLRGGAGGLAGTPISFIAPNINTAAGPGSTWAWDLLFTCRAAGVGPNNFQVSHTVHFANQLFTANGLTTLDTTVSNAMTITARWQVLSANNLINSNQMITTNYYQPTA